MKQFYLNIKVPLHNFLINKKIVFARKDILQNLIVLDSICNS